jgi:peptide subunit release factor RF-3
LEEEGLMQVVFPIFGRREPILGVVGALQFDVVGGAAQERVRRRVRHRSAEVLDRPLGEVARGRDR